MNYCSELPLAKRFFELVQPYDHRPFAIRKNILPTLMRFLKHPDPRVSHYAINSILLLAEHPSNLSFIAHEEHFLSTLYEIYCDTKETDPEMHEKANRIFLLLKPVSDKMEDHNIEKSLPYCRSSLNISGNVLDSTPTLRNLIPTHMTATNRGNLFFSNSIERSDKHGVIVDCNSKLPFSKNEITDFNNPRVSANRDFSPGCGQISSERISSPTFSLATFRFPSKLKSEEWKKIENILLNIKGIRFFTKVEENSLLNVCLDISPESLYLRFREHGIESEIIAANNSRENSVRDKRLSHDNGLNRSSQKKMDPVKFYASDIFANDELSSNGSFGENNSDHQSSVPYNTTKKKASVSSYPLYALGLCQSFCSPFLSRGERSVDNPSLAARIKEKKKQERSQMLPEHISAFFKKWW